MAFADRYPNLANALGEIPSGFVPHPEYGFVGPNYIKHGEKPGYTYIPIKDKYTNKPDLIQGYNDYLSRRERDAAQAIAAQRKPDLIEQMKPLAVGASIPLGIDILADELLGPAGGADKARGGGLLSDMLTSDGISNLYEDSLVEGLYEGAKGLLGLGTEAAPAAMVYGPAAPTYGAGLIGPPTAAQAGYEAGGSVIPDILGPAALAAGIYGMTEAYDEGDPVMGALSGVGAGLGGLGTAGLLGLTAGTGGLALPVAIGGALLGGGLSAFGGHKGTGEYQAERWGDLAKKIPNAADFFSKAHQNESGVWDEGKYSGEQWSYDRVADMILNPESRFDEIAGIGHLGNFEVFGEDWFHVPEDKQIEIVKRLTAEGVYDPDMGDVIISDPVRAQGIYSEVMQPDYTPHFGVMFPKEKEENAT